MKNTRTLQSEAIERIKLRLQQYGQNLDQVEQLCLDNIQITNFTSSIREQIQKCINCRYLTMNDCEIKSLEGFPTMPYVTALELIGNQIVGNDLVHLQNCVQIQMLALDQNKIAHIQDFFHLNNLNEIQHLEIRGNPVCLIEDYRSKIFEISSNLKIIDCQDVFGDEDVMFDSETDEENSHQLNNQQSNQNSNEGQDQQIQQNQYQEQDQFKDYGSRKY